MAIKKETKKKLPLTFYEQVMRLKHAGVYDNVPPNRPIANLDKLQTIDERIQKILAVTNVENRKAGNMLFFVMYDIESNKVRNLIVKYLQKKGCHRVQKSIFLADLEMEKYEEIRNDLTEVQQAYENEDSILIVPISTDLLKSMKIIGKNIEIDVITKSKNTLFF